MTEKSITLKSVELNNHCPECYSNKDLVLTFEQTFVENPFYKSLTTNIIHTLFCNKCNTEIYPVRWTDDIEQVVDYQIRATKPKPQVIKLKKASWLILVLIVILTLGVVLFKLGFLG